MKHLRKIVVAVMIVVSLTGCLKGNFEFSEFGNGTTIKVKNAEDNSFGQGLVIAVDKNETVVISSSLDEGQLKIEFMEVAVYTIDDVEHVDEFGIKETVIVKPGDSITVELEPGSYRLDCTTIGATNGTVKVDTVKK
ncbi:MAG: hypothetical protein E7187_07525 [Erysipelotrichaceae bacterium]|nr:hypothetical protein [Erysipelotrichaceae bacterium]